MQNQMAQALSIFLLLLPGLMASQGQYITKTNYVYGTIGAVVDSSSKAGKQEIIATEMAVEDFFSSTGHKPTLHINDSLGNLVQAARAAEELINEKKVQAIVGLRTWNQASSVANLATKMEVPVVSFTAHAPSPLSHKKWPFLVRVASSSQLQMKAVAAIVGSWKWPSVTIIYEDNAYGTARSMASLICALKTINSEIDYQAVFPPFTFLTNATAAIQQELGKLKGKQCRIFIVHSSSSFSTLLFMQAKLLGMMEKDYVWIATDSSMNHLDSFNGTVISSMQGVVGIKIYFPKSDRRFIDFSNKFKRHFRSRFPDEDDSEPGISPLRAYDSVWAVLQAIEQLRPTNNQNQQPNSHRHLNDSDLVFSSMGRTLLNAILSSNFEGLSGHIQFAGTDLVPTPVFQIVNVLERGYRELGFWSPNLSFSRTVDMKERGATMETLRHVIWPGDPPYVPRGWPTGDKPLRIGVPTISSHESIMSVKYNSISNQPIFDGFSIQVFKMVLDNLSYNLSYKFIPYNGTYDCMVEKLDKDFDAVVGDVAITGNRFQYGEFTQPYSESGVRMVVPTKPQPEKSWIFVKPFTKGLWVVTGAIILYNGLIVWLIEREEGDGNVNGSFSKQIGILVWLSFNTLFSMKGKKLRNNLSRMAMMVWLFVIFVLTSSYTASLSSMLTVQRLEPSVVDAQWLKETKAMVGCDSASFVKKYLEEVLHFDRNCIKPFDKGDGYPKALRNGEIKAAFLEVPYIKYLLSKNCKGFMAAGPMYEVGGFGFAFKKGSYLEAEFSEVIVKLRESGQLRKLENNLNSPYQCSSSESDSDNENGSLNLYCFWRLFVITGTTSTLALFLFLLGRSKNFENNRLQFVVMRIRDLIMGKHSRNSTMQGVQQPSYPEREEDGHNSHFVDICVFRRNNTFP